MKNTSNDEPTKLDRKTVEKNRRIAMKGLCFKLASLLPLHHFKPSKDMLSQQDQLDYAASYIKQLREKIDELKRRKQQLMGVESDDHMLNTGTTVDVLPVVELRDLGSSLSVLIISGLKINFMMHQVVSIIEEEGAEVVTASFSRVGDKIFHTIHAQVKICRVGVDTAKVYQKLQELMILS